MTDAEFAQKLKELIEQVPYQYLSNAIGLSRDPSVANTIKKRKFINDMMHLRYEKSTDISAEFVNTTHYSVCFEMLDGAIKYRLEFNRSGITIYDIEDNQNMINLIKDGPTYKADIDLTNNDQDMEFLKYESVPIGIYQPVLDFANSVDVEGFKRFISTIDEEFNLYPLEKVLDAGRCLLAIRYFRKSSLSVFPKEVIVMIVNKLWLTRKEVGVWVPLK